MTLPHGSESGCLDEGKLPRRDWILLPLIGLLTICLIAGSLESIARRRYPTFSGHGEDCVVFNDPVTGARGIPNSVCWEKIPEGQLTKYSFNSSGYRDIELGPKSPGIYRIVLMGTSIAAGFRVPKERTFAALLPVELSKLTRRTIQLYDEGLPWRSPRTISTRFNEVLSAKPDMVLWILTPTDVGRKSWLVKPKKDNLSSPIPSARFGLGISNTFAVKSFTARVGEILSHPRSAFLLRCFLYESQSQYVTSSLIGAGYGREFLNSEPSAEWQKRLDEFDFNAANMERQANDAGISFVAVLVPDRTQVAMISMMGAWPKGLDPYKLNNELRRIIVSHGGTYIDILPDFRALRNPHLDYYPMDGHLNGDGHAAISRFLVKELTDGSIPALRAAR